MRWLILMAGLGLACGGESRRGSAGESPGSTGGTSTAGDSSGSGGASALGGTGAGAASGDGGEGDVTAAAGAPPDCPVEPTLGACPTWLEGTTCSYPFGCAPIEGAAEGEGRATFSCQSGAWSLVPTPCDPYCILESTAVDCSSEMTQSRGGGSDQGTCPADRPELLQNCFIPFGGYPECGYPCGDDTSWTLAHCRASPAGAGWTFDGACHDDCSTEDDALYMALLDAKRGTPCESDDDCTTFVSACALTPDDCSGTLYVNKSVDQAPLSKLDATLERCAAEHPDTWPCSSCGSEPPPAVCFDHRCVPKFD